MTALDWAVLFGTLLFIVFYGVWKTRKNNSIEGYLKGGGEMRWTTIGLSVMATQASAITFLSTPGLGFDSGLEFVQFYFAMPLALIILSATVIPLYYRLKVYTAYEFLENRFDLRSRLLAALLFLVQRGLAAGITIYAPAIILSSVLGWNINWTILMVGILVIIYTVSGGTKAVSLTQKWQMGVIMAGMFIAFGILLNKISEHASFNEAVNIAGALGKMEVIDFDFSFNDKYNIWTGFFAAIFLFLSYFGTDQSQVQRYLGGLSIKESRLGLMFNGLAKIPMQLFILFVGVMVFVFYQFEPQPAYFNQPLVEQLRASDQATELAILEEANVANHNERQLVLSDFKAALNAEDQPALEEAKSALVTLEAERRDIHQSVGDLAEKANLPIKSKESDYIFITYVMNYLPAGLVGLLFAVIFSAAMSSTSGELNALATTSSVDYYKRLIRKDAEEAHYVKVSKWLTFSWGVLAIIFAFACSLADNLIEVVNVIGSIFYGTILGIFLVGFYLKKVGGFAVFYGALISQVIIIAIYVLAIFLPETPFLSYLWLNIIGCLLTAGIALLLQAGRKS